MHPNTYLTNLNVHGVHISNYTDTQNTTKHVQGEEMAQFAPFCLTSKDEL